MSSGQWSYAGRGESWWGSQAQGTSPCSSLRPRCSSRVMFGSAVTKSMLAAVPATQTVLGSWCWVAAVGPDRTSCWNKAAPVLDMHHWRAFALARVLQFVLPVAPEHESFHFNPEAKVPESLDFTKSHCCCGREMWKLPSSLPVRLTPAEGVRLLLEETPFGCQIFIPLLTAATFSGL